MPATAYDAKGILLESIFGEDPCLILESRSLFSQTTPVPEEMYRVRYGEAVYRKRGKDVTIVAIGHLVPLAMRAAGRLMEEGIDAEVLDLRTIKPLDRISIVESVARTGRLVVADPGWNMAGFAAEVLATVSEQIATQLKANPVRVTFPDSHTPMTQTLEAEFYPTDETIYRAVKECLG
jgi:pyruvate dehydrogenase E1 component beta subunit